MPPGKQRSTLGRRVRDSFFTNVDKVGSIWKCLCGVTRKQCGNGYANLVSHVQDKHKEEFNRIKRIDESVRKEADSETSRSATLKHQISIDSGLRSTCFFDPKVVSVHGWIEFICDSLVPLSTVDNVSYRKQSKYRPIDHKTLIKYMERLTKRVEQKISQQLPSSSSLVFDGWTEGGTHYLAIFASIPFKDSTGYKTFLLGFIPFEDETSQDARQHKLYTEFVLELFKEDWSNIVALCGDNCSTNTSFARISGVPLVGCASHRYNLAVQDLLNEHNSIIKKVNELIKRLRTPISAAYLNKFTQLRAKCCNSTRWSSTAVMLESYQALNSFLLKLDLLLRLQKDIDEYMPTHRENKTIDTLCDLCSDLNSVTLMLQQDDMTVSKVRTIFDGVIEKFPATSSRLKIDASIVQNSAFESGITKIQELRFDEMSTGEREAVKSLQTSGIGSQSCSIDSKVSKLSFAEEVMKKRKISTEEGHYIDTRFILLTTNLVERLFSKAGYSLSNRRKSLTPGRFEMQMLLHSNSSLWNLLDVEAVMKHDS